jgi:hypothetical protein
MLPVTGITLTKPVTPPRSWWQVPQSKPESATNANADTVQISSAAQSALSPFQAAFQEATETPAQTAREARSGDPQAQKLLAREAAAEKADEPRLQENKR